MLKTCPPRPLLLTIATLSCLGAILLLNWKLCLYDAIILLSFSMNVFLIVAVLKRNATLLNISRYFTLFGLIVFGLIPAFILPVFYASLAGAGLMDKVLNGTGHHWPETETDVDDFWMGFVAGLVLEVVYWGLIGVTYWTYVLTTRLWRMEVEVEKKEMEMVKEKMIGV